MKQGVKIYSYYVKGKDDFGSEKMIRNPELVAIGGVDGGGGPFGTMAELVQADIRKQNQLGWYVHQVVNGNIVGGSLLSWMVVYRRDEEM